MQFNKLQLFDMVSHLMPCHMTKPWIQRTKSEYKSWSAGLRGLHSQVWHSFWTELFCVYYSWSPLNFTLLAPTKTTYYNGNGHGSTSTLNCPRPFLSFWKLALNWTKSQHFDKLYQFWIVTIQIQTRDVRDHLGKKKSLMDWKIIMFDHERVKTLKVILSLSILFSYVKSKKLVNKEIWG